MTPTPLTSFTHNCEDILLLRALSDVETGFYIDVGAYDPTMDSVTKVFYDRGWSGINLEPNETFLKRLSQERPRDKNLGYAACDSAGELEFFVIEETGLSTLDQAQAVASTSGERILRKTTALTERLEVLWDRYVPPNQEVHFLKIDVEGAEARVIAGADWRRHRPWVLVVEATVPNSSRPSHAGWEPTILGAGYLFAYYDGVNRYYVAEEHSDLLSTFDRPANPAVDNFKPFMAELIERNMQGTIDALGQQMRQLEQASARASAETKKLHERCEHLQSANIELERRNNDLHERCEHLQYQSRALWERIVFRESGRPKKAFRRALFHTNGKPRGIFRRWILHSDGRPHAPFRKWMTGPDYQQLRAAVRIAGSGTSGNASANPTTELSPRERHMLACLNDRKTIGA